MKSPRTLAAALCLGALAVASALYFTGCAQTKITTASAGATLSSIASSPAAQAAFSSAETVLGSVATAELAQVAAKELSSKSVQGNAATTALWSGVNVLDNSGAISGLIKSIGLPQTASAAASAAPGSVTPAVVNAIASVISTAAGAPPALPGKTSALRITAPAFRTGLAPSELPDFDRLPWPIENAEILPALTWV